MYVHIFIRLCENCGCERTLQLYDHEPKGLIE